jgi:glycerol kinase
MDRTFSPSRSADEVAHRRSRWQEALKRARDWEERTEYKAAPILH